MIGWLIAGLFLWAAIAGVVLLAVTVGLPWWWWLIAAVSLAVCFWPYDRRGRR